MPSMIFVNLPVKELAASTKFFTELGFSQNQQFSDDRASSFAISDQIHVMLLTEPFFKTFTKKEVANASQSTEAILALGVDSREEVDELVEKAIRAGGSPSNEPQDHGFMYVRSFQDPDGHLWEVMWMDPAAIEGGAG
jgi:hypothetical protein